MRRRPADHRPRSTTLRRTAGVVGLAVCAALMGGCGDDGGDDGREPDAAEASESSAPPADDIDLEGSSYVAEEIVGRDLVEGTRLRVEFADESMSVSAGCNSMFGSYVVESTDDATVVRWDGEPASTLVGCPDDLAAQDAWIVDLFTEGLDVVEADLEQLVLEGESDGTDLRIELTSASDTDAPTEASPDEFDARINGPSIVEDPPQLLVMTITNVGDRRDTFAITADPAANATIGPRFFTLGVRETAKFRVQVEETPVILKVEGRRAGRYVDAFPLR